MVVGCESDVVVKTSGGRIVMMGDVIKTLRECSQSTGCAACDCESVEECMNHMSELVGLAADVMETWMED